MSSVSETLNDPGDFVIVGFSSTGGLCAIRYCNAETDAMTRINNEWQRLERWQLPLEELGIILEADRKFITRQITQLEEENKRLQAEVDTLKRVMISND